MRHYYLLDVIRQSDFEIVYHVSWRNI